MGQLWTDINFCFGYKDQTAWGVPAAQGAKATWSWLAATFAEDALERELEDLNLSTGQLGAEDHPQVGRRTGTLTFTVPLTSMATGYDPTAGPVTTELITLIEDFLGGSSSGSYDLDDVAAASTANTVKVAAGTYKIGCCYGFGDASASHAIDSMGWVESQAGGAGTDVTLFEDMRAIPASGDESYGMITIYPDNSTDVTPKTFRLIGQNADHDVRWMDAIVEKVSIRFDAGMRPLCEFTVSYQDRHPVAGDGELTTVPADIKVPNIAGDENARVLLGSNYVASYDNGTAVVYGICGLTNMSLEIEAITSSLPCHAGRQGNGPKYYSGYTCKLSFTAPNTQADLTALTTETTESDYTATQMKLEQSLTNGDRISASGEVGRVAGELFAFLLPSGTIKEQWSQSVEEHKVTFSAVLSSSTYSGDGASTDAGNTTFRLAFG